MVDSGRVMFFEAGQRMVRVFKRTAAGKVLSFRWRLGDQPYLILVASIGAAVPDRALLRSPR